MLLCTRESLTDDRKSKVQRAVTCLAFFFFFKKLLIMHDLIQCKKVNFQKYVQQAYGKAGDGNEMETGNEKLKKEMETKIASITGAVLS